MEAPEAPIVRICVLASSSAGNSTFLGTASTRILIDAGLSLRELRARLKVLEESPERLDAILITHEHSDHVAGLPVLLKHYHIPVLDAILITHEHSDHVAGLPVLLKHYHIPVFLTHLTAPTVEWGGVQPCVETFQAGPGFTIGDIAIGSFTIPHDAIDPVGFTFRVQGRKIGHVTDLGYIPDSIWVHLRGTDFLILESNHDLEMLKVGPYPWAVKQRVMGRRGHLSNDVVSDFILGDLKDDTRTLVLSHLSEHNNHPELARLVAGQALKRRALGTRLVVAPPRRQTELFEL
ncbi:MAG: MBL fold metallo-hydrolase [Acidobacteria bacterium]|nr:MBL fold metallo-hydrolase [Acidobacteriota bacterium]